jgi:hypothetical protein
MTLYSIGVVYILGFLTTFAICSVLIGMTGSFKSWGDAFIGSTFWPFLYFAMFFLAIGLLMREKK